MWTVGEMLDLEEDRLTIARFSRNGFGQEPRLSDRAKLEKEKSHLPGGAGGYSGVRW